MNVKSREQAEAKIQAMAAKLSDDALCLAWMGTEGKPATQELAIVRGWMMDELNERLGDDRFDEWLTDVDDEGTGVNPLAYLANQVVGGRENAERPVAVHGIEADAPVRWLSTVEAQDAAVVHFRRGATIHEYDTTDRNGAPLHVVIATTADQGTVYEFPETPATVSTASSPQAAEPERQIAPPAPTGAYAAALKVCRAKGYAHAPNDALMAGLCQDVIQALIGAVSPQLVWEGAMKRGFTAKELLNLCHADFMAVDDLQWS